MQGKKEKSSILILTLGVLAILAILSSMLFYRASSNLKLAKYESDKIKATYLVRIGIMKMLTELARDTDPYDSLNEDWNRDKHDPKVFEIRSEKVFFGASDESARFNLNAANLEKHHLIMLGLDDGIAREIIEYRTKKGKPGFEFEEEIFLIEDMTQEKYAIIKDSVTIYRGNDSRVNINTASEKVLEAVLSDHGLVQDILEHRTGADGEEGTEDDGIFKDNSDISMIQGVDPALFSVKSEVFRIWAESFSAEDKKMTRGAVAVMNTSAKIYNWKEY